MALEFLTCWGGAAGPNKFGTLVCHPRILGHFAEHLGHCIYDGIWVGEDSKIKDEGGIRLDISNALKELALPVLR